LARWPFQGITTLIISLFLPFFQKNKGVPMDYRTMPAILGLLALSACGAQTKLRFQHQAGPFEATVAANQRLSFSVDGQDVDDLQADPGNSGVNSQHLP